MSPSNASLTAVFIPRLFCSVLSAENMVLYCRMCRKQFSHPLALLQHVQHVHQIKIFETEHDYTPDKDLVAATTHGDQSSSSSSDGTTYISTRGGAAAGASTTAGPAAARGMMLVE